MKNCKPCLLSRLSLPMLFCMLFISSPAMSQNVKITPLGSHDGEFCKFDRAMILEDPDGTRILYDAGRTVAGTKDSRLGKVDVVLVSHMHGGSCRRSAYEICQYGRMQ